MNIGIDISQVIYQTGVSRYTLNLIKALLRKNDDIEYTLFGYSLRRIKEFEEIFSGIDGNYKIKTLNLPPALMEFIFNRIHAIKIERLIGKVDLFHSSDWTEPPSNCPKITTIHDAIALLHPKYSLPSIVSVQKAKFQFVKKESKAIIVPSLYTASEIMRLGISKKLINVVPEAPDPIFYPRSKAEIDRIKNKYKIKGNYIISVGITPRKNCSRIIDSFIKLKGDNDINNLLILGEKKINIKSASGVTFLGHVKDGDLPFLFSGARALVYPSLYEGFGLPILEAYACKTPVVTSNTGAMKEVAGGHACLADPLDTDSIKEAILDAVNTDRKKIEDAYSYSRAFTWENTAELTLNIYKKLCT